MKKTGRRSLIAVLALALALVLAVAAVPALAAYAAGETEAEETVEGTEEVATTGADDATGSTADEAVDEDVTVGSETSTDEAGTMEEEDGEPSLETLSTDMESSGSSSSSVSLSWSAHVQTYGDSSGTTDDATETTTLGTTGESKRLEAIALSLVGSDGTALEGITYRVHCQTYGWTDWVSDGGFAGTTGESKRIEAVEIELTGDLADEYDVYYRVHSQTYGWLDWAKNGETAGTIGLSKRAEAIQIVLVKKGGSAPGDTATDDSELSLSYSYRVQTYGTSSDSTDDPLTVVTLGTTGESKRLEAIELSLTESDGAEVVGGISYRVHVQSDGWQSWVKNGSTAGTTGESKRIEAVEIELTGDLADEYDVYYRVHSQTYGWLDWAKNGETAGTTGLSKRAEAIQIVLVEKGGEAPGDTDNPYVDNPTLSVQVHMQSYGWLDSVGSGETAGKTGSGKRVEALKISMDSEVSGSITYSAHVQGTGWQDWVSDGSTAGTTGNSKRVEAVKIELTGDAADYYDVYYRVYIQGLGWLDWACNGASAGSSGLACRIEAIQVKIVAKNGSAPGSTSDPYLTEISGDNTLDRYLMEIYDEEGTNLKTLFNYVKSYTYIRTYDTPSGDWEDWSIEYAKEMYEDQGGNCYRYASLFCWLARGLGYDAKVVTGYVPSSSLGWAPHGWCEIVQNGTTYICDPDLAKDYPSLNWYFVTYSSAPTTYKKSS